MEKLFEELLNIQQPSTLINLSETFPDIQVETQTKVISLVPITSPKVKEKLTYKSYNSVIDNTYFPSLGHVHFDVSETSRKVDECWVIVNHKKELSNEFLRLVAGSLTIREIDVRSLEDIDNLLRKTTGLPQIMINNSGDEELSYCEQILLEIGEKYDVEIRNTTHNQLLFLKRSNEKTNYESKFFSTCEKFIEHYFCTTHSEL